MNRDQDCSEHRIEDTLLLKFLITRYSEILATDEPMLDPVWNGLGMAALLQNRDLANAFETLVSSGSYTVEEVLRSSINLFLAELHRVESANSTDFPEKAVERRSLTPTTARKFLFWSWREGRKISMSRDKDFRFYPVWELVSWLGLSSDEYIRAFDEKCRFSDSPAEQRIENGLEIVKSAIFKRRIENAFFRQDLHEIGTEPIDKETQE